MRMRHVWIRRAARREPLFLDVECCRVRCVGVREEPPAKELRLQRYDLSGLRLRNDKKRLHTHRHPSLTPRGSCDPESARDTMEIPGCALGHNDV